VTPKRHVPEHIQKPDYWLFGDPLSEIEADKTNRIIVNSDEDIEAIRLACKIGRLALDAAHSVVAPGVTTDEIDKVVHETIIKHDAYPSPLNYYRFPKSV